MQIIYTRHARQRIQQRKITELQVEETLDIPDEIISGDEDKEIAIKQYGTHEIRVVYEEVTPDTVVIFTVIKSKTPKSGRT